MRLITSLGLAALLFAAPAQAFTSINLLDVRALPGTANFEVIDSRGAGPRQFWCAAADYARRSFNSPAAQRIYITQGYGPSQTRNGRRAVGFTLAPDAALAQRAHGGTSVSMREPGYTLTLAHARQFCTDVFDQDDRMMPWLLP